MVDKIRKKLNSRLTELKNERNSFEGVWKDLRDYQAPFRGRFTGEKSNDGKRKDLKIYNNTPSTASRTLAAGMNAGITDPAQPWFRFSLNSTLMEREDVKTYLHEAEKQIYRILAKSNFYDAAAVFYQEISTFGTAVMLSFEDLETIVQFYVPTVGEYYLGNNKRNRVNTIYREFTRTVGQLVEEFGIENCSKHVKDMYGKDQLDGYVNVIHAIEPNDDRIPDMKDSKNKAYRSVYFEKGSTEGKFLRQSGFDDFPGTPVRWSTIGSDVYGTECPGMLALGDSKQLQTQEFLKQEGIHKNVKPPLQAPADMKSAEIMNVPGGVTYTNPFSGNRGVQPLYETRVPLNELVLDIQETQNRINRAFFVDLFLPLLMSNRPSDMKATVAEGMNAESLLMLGPVLERLNNEWLNPTLDRVFALAERAGALPDAPEDLRDADIKIEYISTLQQAQKAVAIAGMERYTGLLGAWAQFDPEVLDKIDFDVAADEAADILGVPPKMVRSGDSVSEVRDGRQAAVQQQQALESAQAAASTAKDLGQANISEDTILGALAGQ